METKHTPGEWRYFKANDGHIIKTDKGCIADVYCNIDDLDSAEEANAKLIAAAPELLQALELVKICTNYKESKIYGENNPNHWTNIIDNAINKATK